MIASELSIGDIGKTFRSPTYRDNNKTSLPIGQSRYRGLPSSPVRGTPLIKTWTLTTIYAHKNGNIKINSQFHLRADTEIERVEDND